MKKQCNLKEDQLDTIKKHIDQVTLSNMEMNRKAEMAKYELDKLLKRGEVTPEIDKSKYFLNPEFNEEHPDINRYLCFDKDYPDKKKVQESDINQLLTWVFNETIDIK